MHLRVMVNGATGLVGMAVIDAFLEAGHEVSASDRPGSDFSEVEKRKVEIIPAELDDPIALEKAVAGVDVIVHVAGIFDFGAAPKLLDKVNHQGTRNILDAVLKVNPGLKRFVQVASVGVYGRLEISPCKEDHPKNPRNAYEKSKLDGENAAFEYHSKHGLPVTSIRPTLIYGPRAKYGLAMFLALFSIRKFNGLKVIKTLNSDGKMHHVHVDDVGRAAVLVATEERSVGSAYNVAAPDPLTGVDSFRTLAEPLGLTVSPTIPYSPAFIDLLNFLIRLVPAGSGAFMGKRRQKKWKLMKEQYKLTDDLTPRLDLDWVGYLGKGGSYDITKLKELGMEWKWPDSREGLKTTVKWYQENKWVP